MNEPNPESSVSRRVAKAAVETLRAAGHVEVTRGGIEPLAREIDELIGPTIASVAPRARLASVMVGEPTSTFGDDRADEEVEAIVDELTKSLMASEHIEDVFAEDHVIRRDLFRVVRDGILEAAEDAADAADSGETVVALATLGYVAKTVAARAESAIVEEALQRAGDVSGASFEGFDRAKSEARYALPSTEPDARLELEEAIADELGELVDVGIVELPALERSMAFAHPLEQSARAAARPKLEALATRALERIGCAVRWELSSKGLKVRVTPLAEHDAAAVDRDAGALLREAAPLFTAPAAPAPGPDSFEARLVAAMKATRAADADAAPASKRGEAASAGPKSKRGAAAAAADADSPPVSKRGANAGPASKRGESAGPKSRRSAPASDAPPVSKRAPKSVKPKPE